MTKNRTRAKLLPQVKTLPNQTSKSHLIIVFFTVLLDLIGFGIIIPLTPYLASEYGANSADVGVLMSVYSLCQFLFSPFWGRLSDRFGRRPVLLMSLLGSAISYLGFAFADSLTLLILWRVFAGVFTANISTAMASIADVTAIEKRTQSMGIIGAAFGIGFIIGPAFGGLLSEWGMELGKAPPFGMSFPSLGAAAICFANFLFALAKLPESLPPEKRKHSDGEATESPRNRLRKVFLAFSKPIVGPLMWIYFLVGLGMAHMEVSLGLFLKETFGWSLTRSSYMFALVGVVMALTQGYLIRKFLPLWGERRLLVIGLLLGAIGLGGLTFIRSEPPLYVLMFLLSVGVSFVNPSILGSISALSQAEIQGRTFGETQSLAALGRILGPLSGGVLYHQLGMRSPFLIGGGLFLLGLGVLGAIFSRVPQHSKSAR